MNLFAWIVVALLAALPMAAVAAGAPAQPVVELEGFAQRTIYHSPETPGYTSWVGLWRAPDGDLRCSFEQRTGPASAPTSASVVLRSHDAGATWNRVEGDIPRGGVRNLVTLADGALLSTRWGSGPDGCGYIVRSTDGGRTWSDRIDLVSPADWRAWPTVLRVLRDGRVVVMAGVWRRGDGPVANPRMTKMMFVSADGGRTWGQPVMLIPTARGVCEESDFVELPSGDLLWIHRVEHFEQDAAGIPVASARMGEPFPIAYSDRMQSIVRRKGDGWEPGDAVRAPFHHSGFPAVLQTREGVILHLATDGIYWTVDEGRTWTRFPGPGTAYYPQVLQLPDGMIVCVGHIGADDVYGTVDQSIQLTTFRLKVRKP